MKPLIGNAAVAESLKATKVPVTFDPKATFPVKVTEVSAAVGATVEPIFKVPLDVLNALNEVNPLAAVLRLPMVTVAVSLSVIVKLVEVVVRIFVIVIGPVPLIDKLVNAVRAVAVVGPANNVIVEAVELVTEFMAVLPMFNAVAVALINKPVVILIF